MADISVVIPTYNSSRTILRCLDSTRNQTSPCAEILVVDRFSNDRTEEIARIGGAKVIQARANRSLARNIGMEHCSASAILFIDSDMILPPTLMEECADGLRKHQALVIPETSVGKGFWAKCKSVERQLYQTGNDLVEAARCFLKSALLSLEGYNSRIESGEDWDLQNRARIFGLSFGRVQSKIIHDEGDLTLIEILKKKYRYGKTIEEYLKINPYPGMRQINPLRRVVAPSLKVIPSDPIHGAGILFLKTLEFTAAGIGRLRGSAGTNGFDRHNRDGTFE